MDKKTKRFFGISVVSVIIVCAIVFVWLTFFMGKRTKAAIWETSNIYMSEMNTQIQQKFSSIINLRLEQVEGMIRRVNPADMEYGEEMIEELTTGAEIRNFSYMGLLSSSGSVEALYGNEIEMFGGFNFIRALNKSGSIVTEAKTSGDEKVLLLGRAAEYPMSDGSRSVALIVGVPMDYLKDVLFLDGNDVVYFHIIDRDGNFIIRSAGAYRENYFDRIKEEFEDYEGKTAEQYIEELKSNMHDGNIYAANVSVFGETKHIYCAPISENSSWYLVSVLSNNFLTSSINGLDNMRMISMAVSAGTILIAMSVIFYLYYQLSKRQMIEINKAREEALHASMAKSEFLSSMSHDIRTPMNAIIGMTEIAMRNLTDPGRTEDCLKKVRLSSKQLLGLINDVLDMSKIESGKMSLNPVLMSLRDVMDDLVNIMRPQVEEKKQLFDIFIQKIEVEEVLCDDVRLNQILLNLLSNAVKYTPEGGRIDIHLYQEESPLGEEFIRTHFTVKDNGIGMSPEFQQKIWDTFSRAESEEVQHIMGSGLGMAITRRIVELMDGTIELESELGKGSTFRVILDLKREKDDEKQMMLPAWNVLVVDDNEMLCLSASANLKELGVNAEWTVDGREAVRMIKERHNTDQYYHFVLIDWKMPGMDGMQTIHEIHECVGMDIPIFLISAYDWSEIEEQISESSIEGFIAKPLFKSTLYHSLIKYADGSRIEEKTDNMQEVDLTGKRVLLAEDIEINWEVASEILSASGLELEWAVNGKECVEKFENSEIGYYDAILMDIRMPVMNGYDATKAIRLLERSDRDLPIIAMTADAFSGDVQQCLDCGMNAHIQKPIDIKECMRILQNYLCP